jgi:hypothetical protein
LFVKHNKWICALAFVLIATFAAFAQDFPKAEVAVGYSFINVHPDLSPITSFNVNGGGGAFVYNMTPLIGIKADFFGYTQGSGLRNQLEKLGYAGQVNGNVFTYMFGPQFKKHGGKLQPFGEALFGAAHSNAYGTIYNAIHGITSASSNNNAFAMEFGGGLDFALTKHFQIRPAEVDYLYTRFGINGTNYTGAQNNFKYMVGANFTFGGGK